MGHLLCRALSALAITAASLAACHDATDPPAPGSIRVTVATNGADPDADGYFVVVDDSTTQALAANGSVTLADLHEGSHVVRLGDVAANCVVSDANPRMVVVAFGQTVATRFDITCQATHGRIDIVTTTTGVDVDADGYTARVIGIPVHSIVPVRPNETVRVDVPVWTVGAYLVALQGVAPNCTIESVGWQGTTRHVEVRDDVPVQAVFAITCAPISTNRLSPGMVLAFSDAGRIARIDSDGSGLVRLTEGPSDDQPAWSPDGTRIAFTRTSAESADIYVMNADGSNVVRRTWSRYSGDPAWSPDGKHIAFSAMVDGSLNVYVMSADDDGKAPTTVVAYIGWDGQPAWSPEGSAIALVSDWVMYDFASDIFVARRDGSQPTQLTYGFNVKLIIQYFHPTWSPDGRKLAVVTCPLVFDACATSKLGVMNADGSALTTLTTGRDLGQLSWSPDGGTIAFSSAGTLRWIKADGSEQGIIGAEGTSPSWRPGASRQLSADQWRRRK